MSDTLIHLETDPRILEAARGARPELRDYDNLPSSRVRFAPSTGSYKVARDGSGTNVHLYGTTEHGHTIFVRAQNFRPYLFVSLGSIDAYTADAAERQTLVDLLLDNLQRALLMMAAHQQKDDASYVSAEVLAFREAHVGYVRQETAGGGKKRVDLCAARKHCSPIVGYRISDGLPLKGHGPNSGYRGQTTTRFLQIFFYCPSLVSKARSLLHGKNARLGTVRQIKRLARQGFERDEDVEVDMVTLRVGNSKMARAGRDEHQRKLMIPDVIDPAAADLEPDEVPEEEDDGEFEALERALDLADDAPSDNEAASGTDTEGEMEDPDDDDLEEESHLVDMAGAAEMVEGFTEMLVARFKKQTLRSVRRTELPMLSAGRTYDVYEADIDFILRFALDCGFAYEQWLTLDCTASLTTMPDGTPSPYELGVERITGARRETRVQIELRTDYRLLRMEADDPIQNTLPQHLVVSLDCEMAPGPRGEFPTPEHEAMLQCVFIVRGRDLPKGKFEFRSVSFTLGSCETRAAPRPNCTERHVLSFADEATMFRGIARFVRALDPHLVTGYNTDGFDFPYMLKRAKVLGVGEDFAKAWGRSLYTSRMTAVPRSFQSTQAGQISFMEVRAEGLVVLDTLKKITRDPLMKLRAYSLNAVANALLDEQKEDVAYSMINVHQKTPAGRETLRSYCEKDALLPLELFEKLQVMPSMVEMSRINVCPIAVILTRGQQVRSKCCLYREAAAEQPPYRFYTRTDTERREQADETFEGAEVVEPKPGLYDDPVVTLDQSSLYPSIMVSHNLCESTLVQPDVDLTIDPFVMRDPDPVRNLTLEERKRREAAAVYVVNDVSQKHPFVELPYERPAFPEGPVRAPRFLRHTVKVGIVPKAQLKYLAHRNRTKAEMSAAYKAGDVAKGNLLNERQKAIKMLANSLYGTLGATCAFNYSPTVSETVTRRGRTLLFLMRSIVLSEFAHYGVDVVYGDTDSIFVSLHKVPTIEEAAKIGVEMAKRITQRMKEMYTTDAPQYNILKLEFEKVFRALLLIAKKRYAGLKYEYSAKDGSLKPSAGPDFKGSNADGVPIMSGLESQRRDTTLLVSETIKDVVALLLDYHYSRAENMERARAYVWQHMVRPLLDGTINRRMLVITKQLRQLPSQYVAKVASGGAAAVPIHVQLAQRLIERAGGENAANAPRAGSRLAYVVVQGAQHEKVSSRGEDPEYALNNSMRIDSRYYLDRHVKPPLLRLFVPILCGKSKQRMLMADERISGTALQFGLTDAARKRANEAEASEYLFGHKSGYNDISAEKRALYSGIVPATRRERPPPRARPRYSSQVINRESRLTADGGKQRSIGAFVKQGARCETCKVFAVGEQPGYVCPACTQRSVAGIETRLRNYLLDIEDLRQERAELADICHDCMGCRDAPRVITCKNTDCSVLWDRWQSASSLKEVEARLQTAAKMAELAKAVDRLEL